MDELTRVRRWDTAGRGPSEETRAAARARLLDAAAEECRTTASRGRRPSRRLVLRGALAGATAAAVGAVVVAEDAGDAHRPRLRTVGATEVLRRAAARTRAADGALPVPRDDQYFYTRTFVRRTPVKGGRTRTWTDESWLSVDGSRPSLREEHGKVHHDPPLGRHEVRSFPTYSELRTLPTDPDRLLARWRGNKGARIPDLMVFFNATMLMQGPRVMPPGLQAAAFEALSKLPRIRLDRDAVDADGRPAVAVSYPRAAFSFLFDRGTYAYLGLRTQGSSPKKVHGEWEQTDWYYETRSLRAFQVVDRIGQRR